MGKNLFYQMYSAVQDSMGEDMQGGIQKRGIKMDPTQDIKDHTYSWNHFTCLVDRAHDFADFIKANHPDIKQVKDLTSEIKTEYLLSKHTSNAGKCNTNSILTYDHQLIKIGHLCDNKYEACNLGYTSDKAILPDDNFKMRSLIMKEDHFQAAISHLGNKSEGKWGLQVNHELGIRISSDEHLLRKNFHFDENTVTIYDAKGNKTFDIPMSERQSEFFKTEFEKRGIIDPNDRVVNCKAENISKCLHRGLERAGLTQYGDHCTGNHAIRKMVAQGFYKQRIAVNLEIYKGDFEKAELEAKKETSLLLGHGAQRSIENYISRYGSKSDFEVNI
ncbi:MAG TPA: hypothetical protein VM577_10765 [Anaerovoracaceae bacterium]|nr:hypothetical protein [Anaerovoracaceae bacterium]